VADSTGFADGAGDRRRQHTTAGTSWYMSTPRPRRPGPATHTVGTQRHLGRRVPPCHRVPAGCAAVQRRHLADDDDHDTTTQFAGPRDRSGLAGPGWLGTHEGTWVVGSPPGIDGGCPDKGRSPGAICRAVRRFVPPRTGHRGAASRVTPHRTPALGKRSASRSRRWTGHGAGYGSSPRRRPDLHG